MKTKIRTALLATALFAALTAPVLAHGTGKTDAQGQMKPGAMMPQNSASPMNKSMKGQGMMGQGMMGHGMMGHGMMGQGMMGQGMMGGGYGIAAQRDLSVEDVRQVLEGRLAWTGNPRLKIGNVEGKDDDTVIAEITTLDGALVDRLSVDRHTGALRRLP